MSEWQQRNLANIALRLKRATEAAPGLLDRQSRGTYELLVLKTEDQIQLYFAEGAFIRNGQVDAAALSGIMSRIDVHRPVYLLGTYTQAMILTSAWVPHATRIYHIGFGGGRIPMVLHHYFPDLVTESTELDQDVVRLARRWFGIDSDDRMIVAVEEGRSYLSRQSRETQYDAILVDCFTGSGTHPYALSTTDFYTLCQQHLKPEGVVATNLVASDPLFEQKWRTFVNSFDYAWRFNVDEADVFFGSSSDRSIDELRSRCRAVYEKAPFGFPFVDLLDSIERISGDERIEHPLTDKMAAHDVQLDPKDTMFRGVGRNDQCPCGSGRKYKLCHGRVNAR